MSRTTLFGKTAEGRDVPILVDDFGNIGGGPGSSGSSSTSSDAKGWSYAAASGGITDTSDVTLTAAPGSNLCAYLSSLQVINKHASTGTEVVVKSGSTVLFREWAGSGGNGFVINFPRALVATENTALTAACITTSTATYVNAQGFLASPPNRVAVEISLGEEVLTDRGEYLYDDASAIIYITG